MPIAKKSLNRPDMRKTFPKGKLEVVKLKGVTFSRFTLQPGWRWSKHIKPAVKTEWCTLAHTQYFVSGKIHVKMKNGAEKEFGPGDAGVITPGHDAWVVGKKPLVAIELMPSRKRK